MNGLFTPTASSKKKARKKDATNVFDIAIDDVAIRGEDWANSSSMAEDPEDAPMIYTPNAKESKRDKKSKKAEKRTEKSKSRVNIVSTEDVKKIADAIHPTTGGVLGTKCRSRQNSGDLVDNRIIMENVGFVSNTFEYYKSDARREYGAAKKVAKLKGTPQTPTTIIDETIEIIKRLNIKTNVLSASKDRKNLLTKLREAIQNDITIMENEDRDTMIRKAGYFRYVNKRTYNTMVRNNQIWDWVSGCKLEEVHEADEESDGTALEEDDGTVAEKVVEDYGEDFIFEGEELKLAERCVAEDYLVVDGTPQTKTDVPDLSSELTLSPAPALGSPAIPIAEKKKSMERTAPPHQLDEHFTPTVSEANDDLPTRLGSLGLFVPMNWDDEEIVDTTYSVTDLKPESLYG